MFALLYMQPKVKFNNIQKEGFFPLSLIKYDIGGCSFLEEMRLPSALNVIQLVLLLLEYETIGFCCSWTATSQIIHLLPLY